MERFTFERPSQDRKADILGYLDEFVQAGSQINGTGGLDRALRGVSFEDALKRCLGMEDARYAAREAHCPGKTFLLIRESDGLLTGMLNLRWDLTEEMLLYGGNIGYSIRPSQRRRGYNRINLYLGLKEAAKLGLRDVLVSCSATNAGSYRTAEALGGVMVRRAADPHDGEESLMYRIDVAGSLDKYAPVYGPYTGRR